MKKAVKKNNNRAISSKQINLILSNPYLIIIALVSAVYIQVLFFNLVGCDDVEIIQKNFQRISSFDKIGTEFFTGYLNTNYYRPIVNMSFWFNAQFGGQAPFIYHLTNVILHILSCSALFYLFSLLGYNRFISLLAASIFAVHPLFVNAVAWIVGRNDLLYSLFLIISFIGLIKFQRTKNWKFLFLHFISFLFACLSKESALIFPLIFIFYIIFIQKNKILNNENLLFLSSWIMGIIIWLLLRSISTLGTPISTTSFNIFSNIALIPELITKAILPVNLSVLPTYNKFNTIAGIIFIFILLTLYYLKEDKNNRLISFGFLWFLILLLPGMFVQIPDAHDWNQYLECRSYLPLVGFLILLIEIIPRKYLDFTKKQSYTIPTIILIVLFITNIASSRNYIDSVAFYESAVKDNPNRAKFHTVLGKIYLEKNNTEGAEKELLEAIRCNPGYAMYYYNLGAFYQTQNLNEKAIEAYKKALTLSKSYPIIYNSLADIYFKIGKIDEGINILEVALLQNKDNSDLIFSIVTSSLEYGNIEKALLYSDKLIQKNQKQNELYSTINHWATVYYKNQQDSKAVLLWKKAIEIEPEKSIPYKNLCQYYIHIAKNKAEATGYANQIIKLNGKLDIELEQALQMMK